jgi:serine/threonine-protein kinase RsbW
VDPVLNHDCLLEGTHDLAVIRDFVEEGALALCDRDDIVGELVVAVNEAVTNILVHGYKNQPGALSITVSHQGDELQVCLEDKAPVFDPTTAPEPDVSLPLERRPLGGVGIRMMREFTDELRHEARAGGGNRLVLVKRQASTY